MMWLLLSREPLKWHSGIASSAQRLGHKSRDNLSKTSTLCFRNVDLRKSHRGWSNSSGCRSTHPEPESAGSTT